MIKVDKYLWRGPRPNSVGELVAKFNHVIDLESGVYDELHSDQYERERRENKYPTVWFWYYHLSNIFPPKMDLVNAILWNANSDENNTYIHCLKGKDRTGYICAAYKMKYLGWSYADAKKELLDLGFNRWIYWFWLFFLKKYEA